MYAQRGRDVKLSAAANWTDCRSCHDVRLRIDREPDFEKLLPHAWKEHFATEVAARREDVLRRFANQ